MVRPDSTLPAGSPRRTALAQDRSRETRRRLVRTAIELWSQRGFERGVEETTVDEIVQAAGVTKGTFYFYFAHKEDILLELGWGTAEVLYEQATAAVAAGRSGLALVRQLMSSLAKRCEAAPRPVVIRSVAGFYAHGIPKPAPGRRDIHHAFAVALEAARVQGELPEQTDVDELARLITGMAMDALLRWSQGDRRKLRTVLIGRADTLIAGAIRAPSPLPSARA